MEIFFHCYLAEVEQQPCLYLHRLLYAPEKVHSELELVVSKFRPVLRRVKVKNLTVIRNSTPCCLVCFHSPCSV